ncbi:DNA repair protein RecO [Candidatus Dojkabacteria bacterium]|jgi:DNA repair protein RecO (recombination protein O)|nr:DNA repair protein RecO [Candidatus Dojkabacteria bacterium]
MRNYKDRVFVIKSTNFGEADKIITVFGKEKGKLSLVAKGVRKLTSKNRPNIQTFSISQISYYQASGLPLLLESEQLEYIDYEDINSDNAGRVLFLLNTFLAQEVKNEKIFKALSVVIKNKVSDEVVNKFRMVFLAQEGLLNSEDICFLCEQDIKNEYLNINNFALICPNCYIKERNKGIYLKINKEIYKDKKFTISLDKYIKKIYSDLV